VAAAINHASVEPRGVASSHILLQEAEPATEAILVFDAPTDTDLTAQAAHTSLVSAEDGKAPVYVHDPDIPKWCYNRSLWDRIVRQGLLAPKECRGLVRADAEDEAEFEAKRKGVDPVNQARRERARNPSQETGRASVWVLLGVLSFFLVVFIALGIPYCYPPKMPGEEYYPQDPVTQAYVREDFGYAQQAARSQQET